MLPYIIIYPLWLIIAVLYPVFEAFRAINNDKSENLRLWLFYLASGVMLSLVWPVIEVAPYAVFSALSVVIGDWYDEATLVFMVALVNPKKPIIKVVLEKLDAEGHKIMEFLTEGKDSPLAKLNGLKLKLREVVSKQIQ